MKRIIATVAATASVLTLAVGPASAAHGRGDLTVGLNGANEVGTEGDRNGSGKIDLAFFAAVDNPDVVFPNEAYVCYELTTRNVDEPTGLHIHEVSGDAKNPRKDAGPVVVNLFQEDTREDADGNACVAMDSEVLDGILEEADEYYVNAHNADFPAGAIRGQLHSFS